MAGGQRWLSHGRALVKLGLGGEGGRIAGGEGQAAASGKLHLLGYNILMSIGGFKRFAWR